MKKVIFTVLFLVLSNSALAAGLKTEKELSLSFLFN
jgi:hypothetical protein